MARVGPQRHGGEGGIERVFIIVNPINFNVCPFKGKRQQNFKKNNSLYTVHTTCLPITASTQCTRPASRRPKTPASTLSAENHMQ